jgi:colanic acid/amylovoran biosynthesis glycosyltransferase
VIRVVHSNPVWLSQTQTWLYTQVTNLPLERVESHVVCEHTANLDQFAVPHLHAFAAAGRLERLWDRGLRRLGARRHLGYLARVARRLGAKVIHSHFGDVAWTNLGAVGAAGSRHVATFYGYDMSYLPRVAIWRERLDHLFRNVDLVLCEGPHMAREVVRLGCPEDRVRIHHLGVALETWPFQPRRWSPGHKLKVLIAATFTEKKGIPYAIRALSKLRQHVELEVTLIGDARPESAESRAQKREILSAIESQGLGGVVRLLGYRPHSVLIDEAYRHHLFLSPSVTAADGATEGGAPVAIVEMAASGMPIVSTRHCDIPEVIVDGRTGFLAEERDVEGLTDCLLRMVSQWQRWPEMLAAGRARVEAEFDAHVQGQRLATLYESLATGAQPRRISHA